jgi:hypothetical protein
LGAGRAGAQIASCELGFVVAGVFVAVFAGICATVIFAGGCRRDCHGVGCRSGASE